MSALDLVFRYMEIFFSGMELDRLQDILHDDLKFRGPLYQFNSAREYIASLQADPPFDCSYKIVHAFEKENAVNLLYNFSKPGISTIVSQLFEVRDGKIINIVLIFDSVAFIGRP
ncbi:nuclear transport factor 2 family protein [Kaarinaea lacus]